MADWLVHSDVSMIKKIAPSEDVYSTKSDLAVNIKMLKGKRYLRASSLFSGGWGEFKDFF